MIRRIPWLLLLVGAPALAAGLGGYQGNLFAQFALYGLATAALALCWGVAGILSLGHAVSFGIGAYVAAWVGINLADGGTVLGIVLGGAAAGLISALVGVVGLRGRLDPITFALLTFVLLFGAVEVVNQATEITGGFNGLPGVPGLNLGSLWGADLLGQRVIVVIVAVLLLWLVAYVARSPLGGALVLAEQHPLRAASSGFPVPRLRVAVFTFAGGVTGIAGGLFATQAQFVAPDQISLALATNFVIWAMIGSRRNVVAGFVTAVVVSFITNELADKFLSVWLLALGVLFVLVVLVAPDGISSRFSRLLPARLRRPPVVRLTVDDHQPVRRGGGLRARGMTSRFGGFTAVDGVDLDIPSGGVHCLIGPNGAGKSTLLNALSGTVPASAGAWGIGDTDLTGRRPWRMARCGVARKFQAPAVAVDLTVAQNLALARLGTAVPAWALVAHRWTAALSPTAWRILEAGRLDGALERPAGSLSHGERQALELAMTFAGHPSLVLLDEPTAGMTADETARVAQLLRDLAVDADIPIVVVEHDMALIRAAASGVTVLQAGRILATGTVEQIEADPEVTAAYVGEPH
jgi:branched-chain amino acid transport system permease protein